MSCALTHVQDEPLLLRVNLGQNCASETRVEAVYASRNIYSRQSSETSRVVELPRVSLAFTEPDPLDRLSLCIWN